MFLLQQFTFLLSRHIVIDDDFFRGAFAAAAATTAAASLSPAVMAAAVSLVLFLLFRTCHRKRCETAFVVLLEESCCAAACCSNGVTRFSDNFDSMSGSRGWTFAACCSLFISVEVSADLLHLRTERHCGGTLLNFLDLLFKLNGRL